MTNGTCLFYIYNPICSVLLRDRENQLFILIYCHLIRKLLIYLIFQFSSLEKIYIPTALFMDKESVILRVSYFTSGVGL